MANPAHPKVAIPSSYASMPYKEILVSHHPASAPEPTPVIIVTLYRPKQNNAFTDVMRDELVDIFDKLSVDDRVKCIVMTGHGKMFCAGLDLANGFRLDRPGKMETEKTHRDEGGRVALAIHNCTKPTIGAIQGHAVGIGITMTLPMTIRVGWDKAKIGFVFGRRGLVCEAASSFFMPRLLGYSKTMHLLTVGATYPATHRLLDGLFSETLEQQDQVLPRALELATEIAENTSTVATFMMREMVWRGMQSAEEAHLLDSRVMGALRGGEDNEEGVKSFLEKRPVKFTGTMARNAPPVHPWYSPVYTSNRPVVETSFKPKI